MQVESRRPRVFGIGFHKTGTTSLAKALERLGYRALHGAGPVRAALGHHRMMELLHAGELGPVWEVAEAFDAFAGNPWFSLFREADARFPGSRFVLTRRDPARWLGSVLNHFGGTESDFRHWIYGVGDPMGHEALVLERYRAHDAAVLAHFAGRAEDLLVMDFERGDGWPPLCDFLGAPVPDERFPHENRRQSPSLSRLGGWLRKRLRYRAGWGRVDVGNE